MAEITARKVRAKRIRREAKEAAEKAKSDTKSVGRERDKVEVEADDIDEYDESAIKAMVANTPEVRFRHASYFSDDEDRIIAASLKSRVQLYKVAASLRCCFNTLKKHIEQSPVLAEIAKEAREIECGQVREAVDDLIRMRHPHVVMWRAKQLMPQEFGEAVESEEDDTRIVIGAIPEELLTEADRKLEEAASKPPEIGLSAMLDPRTKEQVRKTVEDKLKDKELAAAEEKGASEDDGETEADESDMYVADDGGFDGLGDGGFEDLGF